MTTTPEPVFADDARRYRLESRIATGGMGEVWRATDTALGREVAVKLLKPEFSDDPTFRTRFETEARHAASLHHPNVASLYDVGESAAVDGSGVPRPYLVMELVDGQPLSALLRGGRPLDPDAVRLLLAQAADAIGAAHRAGIVHRDVKPANLLVTPDRRIKITDFGIARASDGLGLTSTGQVMGTPQYLSPEQARGNTATPASDVYSLGVVAFECLVGRRPFDAESPVATALSHLNDPVPTLPGDLPADLAAVVRRALSKDPADRYADGAAFATALRDPATAVVSMPPAPAAAAAPPAPDVESTRVMPRAAAAPDPTPTPVSLPRAEEDRSRQYGWLVLLLALLAIAAVVIVLLLTRDDGGDNPGPVPPSTTPSASESPSETTSEPTEEDTPEPIDLNESDYLGRNVDEVAAELREKGLEVDTESVGNPGDEEQDTVASVEPTSGLRAGDTVRVRYYQAPEPTEPTQQPTQQPTGTPPSTDPTPSDPAATDPAGKTDSPLVEDGADTSERRVTR